MKSKITLLILCSLLLSGCAALQQRRALLDDDDDSPRAVAAKVNRKANSMTSLKGATVESTTEADGSAALKVTFESGILFDTNDAELSDEAKRQLNQLVKEISDMPNSKIRVRGHTDITGTAEVNEALSTRRARAVADYLVSKGIESKRITSEGLSFKYPIADNSTEAGRAKNRRVEIYVIPATK